MSARAVHRGPRAQRGASLVVALIAVVTMTFAALALVRSVDTSNAVAGNLAFRQASLQVTDKGVEDAVVDLNTITTASIDANWPAGCAVGACKYYPLRQAVNTAGVPTVINWNNVPSVVVDGSYNVQYVIDRMCDGPTPVTNIAAKCTRTDVNTAASIGSKKANAISFTGASQVYYRVTVRVTGPRNTTSLVQAYVAR